MKKYDIYSLKRENDKGSVIIASNTRVNEISDVVNVASRIKFQSGHVVTYITPKENLHLKLGELSKEEALKLDDLLKEWLGILTK